MKITKTECEYKQMKQTVFHKLKKYKLLMQVTYKYSIFTTYSQSREKTKTTPDRSQTLFHRLVLPSDMKAAILKQFYVYCEIQQVNKCFDIIGNQRFYYKKNR